MNFTELKTKLSFDLDGYFRERKSPEQYYWQFLVDWAEKAIAMITE